MIGTLQAFFAKHGTTIVEATGEHLLLAGFALAVAIIVAMPIGILLAKLRSQTLASIVLGAAGIIQTIPTLAMVTIMVMLFAKLPLLDQVGLGKPPALVALVLYALLPILRNTYTGIQQVDPSVIEVATGMGMTRGQILMKVELPLALPVIMAGVRIATVWTIGIATLAGLVGAGGLGELIMIGLRSLKHLDYLAAGTFPAAALALVADGVLSLIQRWLTPAGLRSEQSQ